MNTAAKRVSGWGTCECGHGIADHARSKPSGNPEFKYTYCAMLDCSCSTYRASDGSEWPHKPAGVPR